MSVLRAAFGTTALATMLLAAIGTQPCAAATASAPTPSAAAPDSLMVHFDSGSATVKPEQVPILDQAARLYRDGSPIVMIVSGSADSVGSPAANLTLSERRALAVLQGLVARGIPVERFQVLAKGETEPAVKTSQGVAEPQNRSVEIRWR